MGFTQEEKKQVIKKLQSMDWVFKDDTIWAPSGGIWFKKYHFEWSPKEMYDIIGNRGRRIEREKHNGWEAFSKEHFQVCEAIESLWTFHFQKE
jgi:hypothetical protein